MLNRTKRTQLNNYTTKYASLETDENIGHFYVKYIGLLYAISFSVCQILAVTIVKYLEGFNASEISFYRSLMEVFICLPILLQSGVEFGLPYAKFMVFRSFLMSVRYFLRISSVQALPLADSSIIYYSCPAFVAIASRIFLKERFTRVVTITIIVTFIGLISVSQFWILDIGRAYGLGSAYLTIIVHSLSDIILKKLANVNLPSKLVVFHMSWMRCIQLFLVTEITNDFTVPTIPKCSFLVPFLFVSLGLLSQIMQNFNIEALKRESASTVSAATTFTVLPSLLVLQYLVFHDEPTIFSIFGAILIIVSSFMMNLATIINKFHSSKSGLVNFLNWLND